MTPGQTNIAANHPIADRAFSSDANFHELYPGSVKPLSQNHWTPLSVARKAALFLAAAPGSRILDIGSGIGKFCLAAAYYRPHCFYTGIEQRADLNGYAEKARKTLGFDNVSFLHGNFTSLDFRHYDHFYFYNSFFENIATAEKIDQQVTYSIELFNLYNASLYRQLAKMPSGTRVATFYGNESIMPPGYHIGGSDVNELLKFWVRE